MKALNRVFKLCLFPALLLGLGLELVLVAPVIVRAQTSSQSDVTGPRLSDVTGFNPSNANPDALPLCQERLSQFRNRFFLKNSSDVTTPIGSFVAGNFLQIFSSDKGLSIMHTAAQPGDLQVLPILPTSIEPGRFIFASISGQSECAALLGAPEREASGLAGVWIDPPAAFGFRYVTTSDSLFTEILDFPTGFSGEFTVSVGDTVLGSFGPGDRVDFTGFPGGGVSEFTVTGISPVVDSEDPLAFPLKVAFNTDEVSLYMESIEAPVTAQVSQSEPEQRRFKITIVGTEGQREFDLYESLESLTGNAATLVDLPSEIDPDSLESHPLGSLLGVEQELERLVLNVQGLFPNDGEVELRWLNPTLGSTGRLQETLPRLLVELERLSKKSSPEETRAIANMLQEIEAVTTFMEVLKPVLNELSNAVAVAR